MEILSGERKSKMNGILIVLAEDVQIQPKEELLLGKKFFGSRKFYVNFSQFVQNKVQSNSEFVF